MNELIKYIGSMPVFMPDDD